MDGELEQPQATTSISKLGQNDQEGSGEDEVLDWGKVLSKKQRQKALPKRGEKALTSAGAKGGSNYHQFMLERAREAMFEALSEPRQILNKKLSQAIWDVRYGTARVFDAKGTSFTTLGHTIRRRTPSTGVYWYPDGFEQQLEGKKLELLPEEAVYLVERGSLLCWRPFTSEIVGMEDENLATDANGDIPSESRNNGGGIRIVGVPMSVQNAYGEMIGREGVSLEHYQVYAYLKRFGYIVRRASPPPSTPEWSTYTHNIASTKGLFTNLLERISSVRRWTRKLFINWWSPINFGWLHRLLTSRSIRPSWVFDRLRLFSAPSTSTQREKIKREEAESKLSNSPYKIFYHVWKPGSNWNRQNLLAPDFEVVVINARTTPMPSLDELNLLFAQVPHSPLAPSTVSPSLWSRILSFISSLWQCSKTSSTNAPVVTLKAKPINPFMALKTGRKSVVLGVVDMGTMSMFRFIDGCFEDWPMA